MSPTVSALPALGGLEAEAAALVAALHGELTTALAAFWSAAHGMLEGSGVRLVSPGADAHSLEQHFFSFLFLYSYYRAGVSAERRVLYATVNQCLRGMVTGCDNLLDDEYKVTLETDLPASATRFRSVLDIMVSDRVLFEVVAGALGVDAARAASAASLRALTRSGAQEADEEGGVGGPRLTPEEVLAAVHHYKTGLLFQAPWVVPRVLDPGLAERAAPLEDALYWTGLGCQVLDDLVDLGRDLHGGRNNYVASLAWHGADPSERRRIEAWLAEGVPAGGCAAALELPVAGGRAAATALAYLDRGTRGLFARPDGGLARAAVAFLVRRIGAEALVPATLSPSP